VVELEASGTSGMKASVNGTPTLSILDGWWVEGYNGENGWAFGGKDVQGDRRDEGKHQGKSFGSLAALPRASLY
jgi:glucan phosphorylase